MKDQHGAMLNEWYQLLSQINTPQKLLTMTFRLGI